MKIRILTALAVAIVLAACSDDEPSTWARWGPPR